MNAPLSITPLVLCMLCVGVLIVGCLIGRWQWRALPYLLLFAALLSLQKAEVCFIMAALALIFAASGADREPPVREIGGPVNESTEAVWVTSGGGNPQPVPVNGQPV